MNSMKLHLMLPLLFVSLAAQAVNVGRIEVPERRGELQLLGAGVLRKGFFFKVYAGALYVANTNDAARILTKVPKRLDIHYFRDTPKKYMFRAALDTLKENLSAAEYAKLVPEMEQLHNAFRDGREGSFASLIYHPGKGLDYEFDGRRLASIPGDRFANAYFSIWLGDFPASRTMKQALMNHNGAGE